MFRKWTSVVVSLTLAAAAALVGISADRQAPIPDYQPVASWPKFPEGTRLGAVTAVAADAADNVYLFHRGPQPIQVYDRDGKFLRSWGDGLIKTAHGLRLDSDGNVWVTDLGHHQVTKFDPTGKVLMTLGQKDKPGEAKDQFNRPADVVVAPAGDFYVADGYGNSRVVKFSKDGKYLKEWGRRGKAEGEFHLPHAIDLDRNGNVHVGDRENNRIQVFDPEGRFLAQWTDSGAPYGVWLSRMGQVLVADGRGNRVNVLDRQGRLLGRWGDKGKAPGQFLMPHGICMDSRGAVYVAEVNGKRVQKFVAR